MEEQYWKNFENIRGGRILLKQQEWEKFREKTVLGRKYYKRNIENTD